MPKSKKTIPFEFVLDELSARSPYTKPMFGALGVYVDDQIVFILRDRQTTPEDNGIWLATTAEHHQSLKMDFPNMRSLKTFGPGPTGWQVLPVDSDDFEESALKACRLVIRKDSRIGKTPKVRKKRERKSSK